MTEKVTLRLSGFTVHCMKRLLDNPCPSRRSWSSADIGAFSAVHASRLSAECLLGVTESPAACGLKQQGLAR